MNGVPFFVAGVPVPQGSKKGFSPRGSTRVTLVDVNKDVLKPWRAEIARVARASWADRPRLEGPVRLSATFVFARPKSVKRAYPSVKPDLDKLLRAICDGITDAQVVWRDDAQVVQAFTDKFYGAVPGVHVIVTEVSEAAEVAVDTEKAA